MSLVFQKITEKGEAEKVDYLAPKFVEGLIPCIVQDATTLVILMFAFMNEESLKLTIETKTAHYFSRSRGKIWKKGESSGNVQEVTDLRVDCDQDVLLIRVKQTGGACHTGYNSCFYRKLKLEPEQKTLELEWISSEKVFDPAEVYHQKK